MGIIDPMAFGSMVTTGVLEFGSGPLLWGLTIGLLAAAAAAIAASAWSPRRSTRFERAAVLQRGAVRLVSRTT